MGFQAAAGIGNPAYRQISQDFNNPHRATGNPVQPSRKIIKQTQKLEA